MSNSRASFMIVGIADLYILLIGLFNSVWICVPLWWLFWWPICPVRFGLAKQKQPFRRILTKGGISWERGFPLLTLGSILGQFDPKPLRSHRTDLVGVLSWNFDWESSSFLISSRISDFLKVSVHKDSDIRITPRPLHHLVNV